MLNLAAIEHHAFDNYCYPLNENELSISIRTGKDVKKIYLLWGDPFDLEKTNDGSNFHWLYKTIEITEKKELQYHYLWNIVVEPAFKRCKYLFKICGDKLENSDEVESYIYGESGIRTEKEYKKNTEEFYQFIFPWMNKTDICNPPKWPSKTVWYQIFPARFRRGKLNNEPDDILPWGSADTKVRNEIKFGGNLPGITEKLEYLEELGITGIYLNPINISKTEHKYDTIDYFEIDPAFGTKEDMKMLVEKAHKHGIKIMLDGVFNHSGWLFFAWQDVLKNRQNSKYADWYMVNDWDFLPKPAEWSGSGKFFAFAFCDYMPKLNTSNPEVRKYIIDVCEYWVKEYDIDALRLDVANEICHTFNKELKIAMRALKDDFYIIGEIWHNSLPWLRCDEFDSIMNYPLENAIYEFGLDKTRTSKDFEFNVNRCLTDYFAQTELVLFNLMDSHDTMRLVTKTGNKDLSYQMLALLFGMPGSPCIYYGTEVMLEGGKDPDCRRCMPWKEIEEGKYTEEINIMKNIIKLRKQHDQFCSMKIEFCYYKELENDTKNRVLCIKRTSETSGKSVMMIFNFDTKSFNLVNIGIADKKVLFSRNYGDNELNPYGIVIYELND